MGNTITRRTFLEKSGRSALVSGVILSAARSTRSAQGAIGANERIRVGMIGCGDRGNRLISHHGMLSREEQKDKLGDRPFLEPAKQYNAQVVACCDIWKQRLEKSVALVKQRYGVDPSTYKDYRGLLDDSDIDAVIIATPDHQHCQMLIDAVRAGKDVYIEKPIAMNMKELNAAYDAVKASKCVVQHGTHERSLPLAASARDFMQSGKLGKVLRAEQSFSLYEPYWNLSKYDGPEKESDTDWRAFLFNQPYRPFDTDQYGHWMGYRDFSTGPVGGWMSHFSDFVHFVTGCDMPVSAVAQGGIHSPTSKKERTCPDTITGIIEYGDGFTTSYTTHFGSGANNYKMFFGTKGVLRIPVHGPLHVRLPEASGEGSEHPKKITGTIKLDAPQRETHMANWLRCIRERKQPNADMDAGYKQGVAVLLVDCAFVESRKMVFDPKRREIRPA